MRKRPFFSYFGAKFKLARHYEPPRFSVVIEPFAGAAGYSSYYLPRVALLFDLNSDVCAAWDYLIHVKESEFRRLPLLEKGEDIRDFNLPKDAIAFLGFWAGQGDSATRHVFSARAAPRWITARDAIANQLRHIRGWRIINESVVGRVSDVRATWFVDPPYEIAGTRYRHGSKSIDFEALGEWCRTLRGQTIVCENAGATWLPFRYFRNFDGNFGMTTPEVIWTNDQE